MSLKKKSRSRDVKIIQLENGKVSTQAQVGLTPKSPQSLTTVLSSVIIQFSQISLLSEASCTWLLSIMEKYNVTVNKNSLPPVHMGQSTMWSMHSPGFKECTI